MTTETILCQINKGVEQACQPAGAKNEPLETPRPSGSLSFPTCRRCTESTSFALLPRCRLKLGNLFQSDGEQFGGLIASAAGLDGLDCLPEYLFGLGL